ncbi:hypothetical protein JADG_010921 [Aureobasidium aubasidani]|nr:hypothetical protein JADG_010921 [Aureobasidium pullulans]
MSIHRGGLPFNIYQSNLELLKFLKALNPALKYSPPTRARLAGDLLKECSDQVTTEVMKIVGAEKWINVITDESGARNRDRVVNLSINTALGQAFFIESFNAGEVVVGGEWLRDTITEKVRQLTGGNLSKWNSICTDTCSAQRGFHAALQEDPATAHVFCVLCDNHGLQLGMKDCMDPDCETSISFYSELIREVNIVLTFFRASDKVWQLLLQIAQMEGENLTAFAIACVTRWGSYFEAVNGLLKNRSVLKSASSYGIITNADVKKLVDDERWWARVQSLQDLIKPFHFAQKLSENDRSTVGMVIPRWRQLRAEIAGSDIPCKEEVLEKVDERMAIQTTDIHHAAFLLNCQLDEVAQTEEEWAAALRFIDTHVSINNIDQMKFWGQLTNYFERSGPFARAELWTDAIRFQPSAFWLLADKFGAPELAKLAGRLAVTPANSVPSERSFLAMNYIQNTFRAKMSTPVTSQLCNVYMNSRALDRRKALITDDWKLAQIKRRSERFAARNNPIKERAVQNEDIKQINREETVHLDDLIDEAAVVIPAAHTASIKLEFPFEDRLAMPPPPPPIPQARPLPPWVRLPSQRHQEHLHLDPQFHPTKKRPAPRSNNPNPRSTRRRKVVTNFESQPSQPSQISQPATPPRSQSSQSSLPANSQFSIGSSALGGLATPSQTPRNITSSMPTAANTQDYERIALGEISHNVMYTEEEDVKLVLPIASWNNSQDPFIIE